MPGYIALAKFTQQGISDVKDAPDRIAQFKAAAQKMGVTVVGFWATLGRYDYVVVMDAPDDKAMGALTIATGRLGNVSTETMRAFSEDEFKEVIGKLG